MWARARARVGRGVLLPCVEGLPDDLVQPIARGPAHLVRVGVGVGVGVRVGVRARVRAGVTLRVRVRVCMCGPAHGGHDRPGAA